MRMVITIELEGPWFVIILSICTLSITIICIFCCICWRQKKNAQRFYNINKGDLKLSNMSEFSQTTLSNLRVFRSLSVSRDMKNESIFTSKNLPFFEIRSGIEHGMETTDNFKSFENSTVESEGMSQNSPREDLYSCVSTNSLYTFYMTHSNLEETTSMETFVSIDLNTSTNTNIN